MVFISSLEHCSAPTFPIGVSHASQALVVVFHKVEGAELEATLKVSRVVATVLSSVVVWKQAKTAT